MSNFKVCITCGKKFANKEGDYCNNCSPSVEDESFEVIRQFLEENPSSNVMDVVRATGIRSDLVFKFINDGRVSINSPEKKQEKKGIFMDGKKKPSFGFRSVDDRKLRKKRFNK